MKRWLLAPFMAIVSGAVGYIVFDFHRAGHFSRPGMPEGAFSLSLRNGLRAISLNITDERETRRYLGYPMGVPFFLEDAWSVCSPPTAEDIEAFFSIKQRMPGKRLEAVCVIDVDDETVIRGAITTVPKV